MLDCEGWRDGSFLPSHRSRFQQTVNSSVITTVMNGCAPSAEGEKGAGSGLFQVT